MKKSLELLNQIIEKSISDDRRSKDSFIADGNAESWMTFHLKALKESLKEEFNNER